MNLKICSAFGTLAEQACKADVFFKGVLSRISKVALESAVKSLSGIVKFRTHRNTTDPKVIVQVLEVLRGSNCRVPPAVVRCCDRFLGL